MSKKKDKKLKKAEKLAAKKAAMAAEQEVSTLHQAIAFTEDLKRKAMDAFDDWVRGLEMRFGPQVWQDSSLEQALFHYGKFLTDVGQAKQEREQEETKPDSGQLHKYKVFFNDAAGYAHEAVVEAPTEHHAKVQASRQFGAGIFPTKVVVLPNEDGSEQPAVAKESSMVVELADTDVAEQKPDGR